MNGLKPSIRVAVVALRKESVDRNCAMQIVVIIVNAVALRKESVDRNRQLLSQSFLSHLSLSARRAWIEIAKTMSVLNGLKPSLSARRAWIEM